jgi:formiminoglutamase
MKAELIIYSSAQTAALVKKRSGETKLGEKAQFLEPSDKSLEERLARHKSKYVLLGIPEDIGVRANHGRGGAYSAWNPVLSTILNIQSNEYLKGDELLVLGHIDCSELMESISALELTDSTQLSLARSIVEVIDESVWPVAKAIFAAGKELIVIGGGHNNAFPLLKGLSKAKGKPISCINCDAHADLRPTEGRHSGNGFSYAIQDGYLSNYAMLGLQEIFNTNTALQKIEVSPDHFQAITYESIFLYENLGWKEAISRSIAFTKGLPCGVELDIDLIQNIPSSAKTSSGISTLQARQYVYEVARNADTCYFHIAEAAPVLSHIKTDLKTGKLIAYLVTDYIKARNSRNK